MGPALVLDREEYIEQAYFFRTFRQRMAENVPSQQILRGLRDEVLATTRLPFAIDFMLAEIKHSGELAPAFAHLAHYFTPFQAYLIDQAERAEARLTMDLALSVLEREAAYKAQAATPQGLFVYHFETLCRNRLGYDRGLMCVAEDGLYDESWRQWIRKLPRQLGHVDFAELLYARSEYAIVEMGRRHPDYQPKGPALFAEREGRIARANCRKDPLYLFAALQRQLGYPEVPRPAPRDDTAAALHVLQQKLHQLEARLKLIEEEVKGGIDLSQFQSEMTWQPPPK
jgi:hypothetical protein